jgi:hypothetical protein
MRKYPTATCHNATILGQAPYDRSAELKRHSAVGWQINSLAHHATTIVPPALSSAFGKSTAQRHMISAPSYPQGRP